jgi:ATP-dependent helicase HrpB
VRLQEVFGLATTPSIGGGAVPVTFKLLSPAQQPVQITRDLAGFWRSSYVEVRKDMRGRYPRTVAGNAQGRAIDAQLKRR